LRSPSQHPDESGFLRRAKGTLLRSTDLDPSDHGTGESTTSEGGTSIDDADVRVLFRSHQPHVAYERRNPSGDIILFTIRRSAVGPIAAETFPERAVKITARE